MLMRPEGDSLFGRKSLIRQHIAIVWKIDGYPCASSGIVANLAKGEKMQFTVHAAKTNLSKLIDAALSG